MRDRASHALRTPSALLHFALALGLLLGNAGLTAPAHAVHFDLHPISGATGPGGLPRVGDTVLVELTADTGPYDLQAWFHQVNHPGQIATAASVEPFLFLGGAVATPLGNPVPNGAAGGDATGQWAMTVGPPNAIPPGQAFVYGQITLELVAPGVVSVGISEAGGVIGPPCGDCFGFPPEWTFGSFEVIPEPGTGLLVGLGLAVLSARPAPRRGHTRGGSIG